MKFRPNTYDASIFDFVYRQNEYELANLSGATILDIGGHIGCFAFKAISLGAERVVSFEPDKENYELAQENLSAYDNVEVVRAAVTRSDKKVEVRLEAHSDAVNSGGCCSITGEGEVVPSVSLDDAIDAYGPNFIKIDCEGGEFPALYSCTKLDQIDTIVGEFHNAVGTKGKGMFMLEDDVPEFLSDFKGRLSIEKLAEFLKEQGFRVLYEYTTGNMLGLFWASRSFDRLLVEPV